MAEVEPRQMVSQLKGVSRNNNVISANTQKALKSAVFAIDRTEIQLPIRAKAASPKCGQGTAGNMKLINSSRRGGSITTKDTIHHQLTNSSTTVKKWLEEAPAGKERSGSGDFDPLTKPLSGSAEMLINSRR